MEIESSAAEAGDTVLVLESNPSTGYGWHVAAGSGMVKAAPHKFEKHTLGYGIPERQTIYLKPGTTGGPIKLIYSRSWENAAPTRQLKLKLASMPATLDLSNPGAPVGPLSVPAGVVRSEVFPALRTALPSHFDWRDQAGVVTPVRDQGNCGSCWAFGTVGVMESSLGKNGISGVDLSEQFLVSCNYDGWDCETGGYTAHKYHYDTLGKNQAAAGAVLESVKPYTGTDGTCSSNYSKAYKLTGWEFVTGSEQTVPTDTQIKTAIQTYGPITAGVCAGDGWYDYTSGVYDTDDDCGGSTNHQIVLVGWDDAGGYWILRNSWGADWGIDGYMHIKYGISRVGEGTSWVTTSGSTKYSLTVTKAGNGTGTVTSTPSGINCGSTCAYSFASGTAVTLTASPTDGSTFSGWSSPCSGTGTCTVTMSSAKSVTATFTKSSTYTLAVSKTGTGTGTVSSTPSGINCGSTCSYGFASGTAVTLTASPTDGSTFTGWSSPCSGTGTCTVTMSSAKSVTATFTKSSGYTLTVTKAGTGTGTVTSVPTGINCGSTCSSGFDKNVAVVLTATPASGSGFAGWSSPCSGTGTCRIVMSADKSVTATFTSCTYTLKPTDKTFAAFARASVPVAITAAAGCPAPSATPNNTWVHAATPTWNTRTGKGAVTVWVDANSASSQQRTGSATIGGKTFAVTQPGKPCTVTIKPAVSQYLKATGQQSGFAVTTSLSDCVWTAAADTASASWVTKVSPASGTGNGSISYTASANPSSRARIGKVNILYNNGKTKSVHTVRQLGAASSKAGPEFDRRPDDRDEGPGPARIEADR